MKRLVKTEFYKLCKADHTLLIALLFLYPVMWSVLAYRNEIVLVENGHSMFSWILIQLFSMEKSFILFRGFKPVSYNIQIAFIIMVPYINQ